MKVWAITLAVLGTFLIVVGWATLFFYPDFWYWVLLGIVVVAVGVVVLARRRQLITDWPFGLHIIVFVGSVFVFLFFLRTGLIYWLVLGGFSIALLVHLLNLSRPQPIREIGQLVNLVAAFAFFYSLYSLTFFFGLPDWQLILIVLGGVMALIFPWLPQEGKRWRSLFYSLIVGIILAQIAWVFTFWPTTTLVISVLLLLFFYVISNIVISFLWEELDFRRVWQYIVIAGALAGAILVTANWSY
ncbi:hypothetical protein ACFL0Z_01555 [Patescibacteria group bacterium]